MPKQPFLVKCSFTRKDLRVLQKILEYAQDEWNIHNVEPATGCTEREIEDVLMTVQAYRQTDRALAKLRSRKKK
jgi:hypothetical protein